MKCPSKLEIVRLTKSILRTTHVQRARCIVGVRVFATRSFRVAVGNADISPATRGGIGANASVGITCSICAWYSRCASAYRKVSFAQRARVRVKVVNSFP